VANILLNSCKKKKKYLKNRPLFVVFIPFGIALNKLKILKSDKDEGKKNPVLYSFGA
jgi:invasion protein IalB